MKSATQAVRGRSGVPGPWSADEADKLADAAEALASSATSLAGALRRAASAERQAACVRHGLELHCQPKAPLDLSRALRHLNDSYGVTRVLAEGGGRLNASSEPLAHARESCTDASGMLCSPLWCEVVPTPATVGPLFGRCRRK